MRKISLKIFLYGIIVYFFVLPKFVYAYLDPGTGSYLFQLLIAGFLGVSFFFRGAIGKVKELFKKKPLPKTTEENEEN